MGIDFGCGRRICVAELVGRGHKINAVRDHVRGHGMPESVGMDVRQAVFLRKAVQPLGDAVWRNGLAGLSREDVTGLDPAISAVSPLLRLDSGP